MTTKSKEKWFMYVLPEEAAKYDLESDGPKSIPVLEGQSMCSMGVWVTDRSIADQVGQAGWDESHGCAMDAVLYFCQFVCESEDVGEFYLWDDAEGGWWSFLRTVGGIWVEDDSDGGVWTTEELM